MKKKRNRRPAGATTALRAAATTLKAQEALAASASVIAARAEMAALALAAPSAEANAEMGLMVTEKLTAFSEAGAATAAGAADLAAQSLRYATEEASAAADAMAKLSRCRTPLDLFDLQTRMAAGFFGRSLAFGLSAGASAARTGGKALAPIHRTVTANHKRLKRD